MQDLFSDYEGYNKEYIDKLNLYDKSCLWQFEILDGLYHNIEELQPGVDLICLDYMDFSEYNRLVSSEFLKIFKNFMKELEALKKDCECAFNLKEALKTRIKLFGSISFYDLIRLFQLFNVTFKIEDKVINVYINDYVYNIIIANDYNLIDDDGNIKIFIQNILGEEGCNFIKFYINYQSFIRNRCTIDEAYTLYKKTCIIR